ncbi:MAG: DEAD/DEAH box helicase [Nitriliruptoraceae bacterium]
MVHRVRLPERDARAVPLPAAIDDLLRQRLALHGITQLWSHQAEMFARARSGHHTIAATGTASGKSLAYQLPVLDAILRDDATFVLYLAPTKALAHDQLRSLRAFRLPAVRAAAIDGDTPTGDRDAIRRTANVLLTNPDLLHYSLLTDHRRWATLLHRLAYVVVDEAHTARGVFGSHVALVLRRLRRLAAHYGSEPTWLFASATIGNPAEHASRLVGLDVAAVTDDGAPRGARDVAIWQPPQDADGTRASTLTEAARLLAGFVTAGVRTLVFAQSRKAAEVITLIARDRLAGRHGDDGAPLGRRLATYRAGYLADDRRELERRLREGDLLGVAATDALELGIDVSGLDAVVLAGWPGTSASFWQRVGRAGRHGAPAVAVLVARDDPIDQFFVSAPDELLTREPEDAIIDPANPYLLAPHLRCACQELGLTADEAHAMFGPTAATHLRDDADSGVLRVRDERYLWVGRKRAAAAINLRSTSDRRIRIVERDTGQVIGDVDEPRAHHQVHQGANYLHQGRQFLVDELDLDQGIAFVDEPPTAPPRTRPRHDTDVAITWVRNERAFGAVRVVFGAVRVTTQVTGFDVLADDTVVDRVDLSLPPVTLDTMASWYVLPDDILRTLGLRPPQLAGTLHAAEHVAIGMLGLIALCDRWDLGGLSTVRHPDTGNATVFIYDAAPGGAGLSERAHARFGEHQHLAWQRVADCSCPRGCPSCIQSPKCGNGNEPLDKAGARELLAHLVAAAGTGGTTPSTT